jgi:hypothetical protein
MDGIFAGVIIGLFTLLSTIYFSYKTKQRENDSFMKELFKEFNKRYDKLNGKLYFIIESQISHEEYSLTQLDKNVLYDFFNLCAEEFFWYKKGRIDPKLWKSWNAGMNFWFSHQVIKDLWLEEMKSKTGKTSYYLEKNEEFFE